MGTYCTTTTLETMWGGASFANLTSSASLFITQAENEINKVLSQRYDISTAYFQTATSVPPMVTTICEWIALGNLIENKSRGSKDSYARADRYLKKAMSNLMAIVDYKMNLIDSDGDLVPDRSNDLQILGNSEDYHNTFNEDDPLSWNVDGDKLDDIADERD